MKPPVIDPTPLTAGQAELLRYMQEFFLRNYQLPPLQVTADHFGWKSKQAAADKVHILVRKGYLERNELGKLRFARAHLYVLLIEVVTQSPPCAATAAAPKPKPKPKPAKTWRTGPA